MGFRGGNHRLTRSSNTQNHQSIAQYHFSESSYDLQEQDHKEGTLGAYQCAEFANDSIHQCDYLKQLHPLRDP